MSVWEVSTFTSPFILSTSTSLSVNSVEGQFDFYFFIGGKIEFGETLLQACLREVAEECNGAKFDFKKILYVRDYIKPEENEHSVELYVLGDIDKFEEIEGLKDKEFDKNHWQTWVDLDKLGNIDVRPKKLVKLIFEDYKNNFVGETKYLGEIG